MPRFSSRQRQRIRQLLLDQAAAMFTDKGYAGTTVDDIAAAAGIAKGSLYRFYQSKEDLFLAVFDREHQRYHEQVAALVSRVDVSKPGDVKAALRHAFEGLYANPLLSRALETRNTPVWLRMADDPSRQLADEQANVAFLAGLIAEGQAAGVIRSGDPQALAGLFSRLLAGVLLSTKPGAGDTAQDLQLALDLVVDGLYTKGGVESC